MNIIYTPLTRLQTALDHREPDRVPLDIGSTKVTGINIVAYRNLLQYKGWNALDRQPRISDEVQQLAKVSEPVLQAMEVDVRGIIPVAANKDDYAGDSNYIEFTDEWQTVWRMPRQGGLYFDVKTSPLADLNGLDELTDFSWPNPQDPGRLAGIDAELAARGPASQHGLMMHGLCAGLLEMAGRLRGYEQFFMDLVLDPDYACGLLDKIMELKMAFWDVALDKAGDQLQIAVEADDLGTQASLLVSPDMYRKYFKPRHQKIFSYIKSKASHLKIFFHSCGSVYKLIPDLIEAGIDILNPVQISAQNMDLAKLKREFGDDIVFWGAGVDTQKNLPHGTVQSIRDEVKRNIEILAPGGGFVFSAVHNIQADVPPENLVAMLEAFQEYGIY